jgi:hypothetical protein
MKPLLQSRTPTQLLWLIAAANALVIIGFGVLRYRSPHLLLWCSFAAVVFGLVSSLVVEQALRNGISSDRWPEKLLEAPRKFMTSGSPILCGFLILGSLANVVFSPAHQIGGTWMFFAPLLTLTRVATCLRPKPASDRLFQPREQSKSLQSENWGSPPRPFSN